MIDAVNFHIYCSVGHVDLANDENLRSCLLQPLRRHHVPPLSIFKSRPHLYRRREIVPLAMSTASILPEQATIEIGLSLADVVAISSLGIKVSLPKCYTIRTVFLLAKQLFRLPFHNRTVW